MKIEYRRFNITLDQELFAVYDETDKLIAYCPTVELCCVCIDSYIAIRSYSNEI